jgi:hypothetical protein
MKNRVLLVLGASAAMGAIAAIFVYANYYDTAVKLFSMAVNYVKYLNAPAGTTVTELAPGYRGSNCFNEIASPHCLPQGLITIRTVRSRNCYHRHRGIRRSRPPGAAPRGPKQCTGGLFSIQLCQRWRFALLWTGLHGHLSPLSILCRPHSPRRKAGGPSRSTAD